MKSKKAELRETEKQRNPVQQGGRENGEMLVKGYKPTVIRLRSPGDIMYSMVIIVINTVLYT